MVGKLPGLILWNLPTYIRLFPAITLRADWLPLNVVSNYVRELLFSYIPQTQKLVLDSITWKHDFLQAMCDRGYSFFGFQWPHCTLYYMVCVCIATNNNAPLILNENGLGSYTLMCIFPA